MRGIRSSLGIFSLILLFFGGSAFLLTREISFFVVANVALGLFALISYLTSGRASLRAFLGERSTKYGANAALYSLLFVGVVVMGNFLSARHSTRIDTTEAKVFSLSPQSAKVARELPGEVEMIAFVEGGKDPVLDDLFKTYAHESPKIKVEMVDPDKSPDLAEKYKIGTYNTVRVAYGEQSTLVNKPDEEALTNAIVKVTQSTKKTLCVVEGHGEPDIEDVESPRGYGSLKTALESENYTVKKILLATQEKPPADCNLLIVPMPQKPYLPPEVELLKSTLQGGGRAMFLFAAQRGEDLVPLVAGYGIKIGDDVVVDQVVRLFQGPALGLDPIASSYGAHPITEGFTQRTIFPLTRSVEPVADKKKGIEVTSIVNTSASSWAESDLDSVFQKGQVSLDPGRDRKGPVSIAVAAKVNLKETGADREGELRLVVFGSDQFTNNKNINNFYNRDLMMNAVGWTVGEEKLISIRPRNLRASRVQLTEDEVQRIFYISVLVLPELLLLAGIAVWARRRNA